jgi:hypothetical protein
MADIDVDYRSSSFPKAMFNGHLTASNSDVRAGGNLQLHDQRWEGLNGWWREVFGLLGSGRKPPKEEAAQRTSLIICEASRSVWRWEVAQPAAWHILECSKRWSSMASTSTCWRVRALGR